jgi:probable F420-dependent oxidoreductase
MRFGLGVPTATEGLMYPVPYASVDEAVELAVTAERLGFDSVWGNDHVSTQAYVREEFAEPPCFLDPWIYLAYVAARTTTLRLATCVTVLPFRHPVVLAKQIATLDRLSGGRLTVGVGIGAYREEFEAMWPGRRLNRGAYAAEALESLRVLFTERRASYQGSWVSFDDVESHPKPVQSPLPVLSGGNAPGSRRRAATLATGWLPACLTPEDIAAGRAEIAEIAGGLPDGFEIALQVGVCLGRTREEALDRFRGSQLHSHLRSLSKSTLKGRDHVDLTENNLIGTPDDVRERVEAYRAAGVTTLAGLLFAENTVEATTDAMAQFSEEIMK